MISALKGVQDLTEHDPEQADFIRHLEQALVLDDLWRFLPT